MGDGRRATAPCGHEGETVIGTYVTCGICDRVSDGVPEEIEAEGTRPLCKDCGSGDTEPFATESFLDCWHCLPCGYLFWV